MKTAQILKSRPLIVGTLNGSHSLNHQIKLAKHRGIDLVEVRLDTFKPVCASFDEALLFSAQLIGNIRNRVKKPILLTLRSPQESGPKRGPKILTVSYRLKLLKKLIPFVDMVDLEIRHADLIRSLRPLCKKNDVRIIHSYHDFKGVPNEKKLFALALKSKKMKSDFFKLAVTLKSQKALEKFIPVGLKLRHPAKILIGMGPHGAVTRLLGFSFDSLMTYGHLGKSSAPGQIPAAFLGKKIRQIYKYHGN